MLVQGGCEEGAADGSNLRSDPLEGETEVGKVEVEVAEEGLMVGKWWCGGSDEQGARWAWQPVKEAKEGGRKGVGEAC